VKLVPIPFRDIEESRHVWLPFLQSIADHSGFDAEQLLARITSGEVQPIVIWDEQAKEARAFGGMRLYDRGKDRIAEVIWMTGSGKDTWTHLIGDFENYARSLGCAGVRMFARRGWKPFFHARGYRETHVILDRELN
jgi:hypothetical protein